MKKTLFELFGRKFVGGLCQSNFRLPESEELVICGELELSVKHAF